MWRLETCLCGKNPWVYHDIWLIYDMTYYDILMKRGGFQPAPPSLFFSRMRSGGSSFTLGVWGWGCVRQKLRLCSQPSATVCVSAVTLSSMTNASGMVSKVRQVDSWRRSYIDVCRRGVCVSDLCRRSYIDVCRRGVCVSDLCRRRIIGVCRGGVSVSDLWRASIKCVK